MTSPFINTRASVRSDGVGGGKRHQHLSVFHLVGVLRQDAALVETATLQDARGRAPAKRL